MLLLVFKERVQEIFKLLSQCVDFISLDGDHRNLFFVTLSCLFTASFLSRIPCSETASFGDTPMKVRGMAEYHRRLR